MLPLTATQTVTTTASPDEVWRAFEQVKRWPKTMRTLRNVSVEPPGPLRQGSLIFGLSGRSLIHSPGSRQGRRLDLPLSRRDGVRRGLLRSHQRLLRPLNRAGPVLLNQRHIPGRLGDLLVG